MEESYQGACIQSLFEPKVDFNLNINKSIKLFITDLKNLDHYLNVNEKNTPTECNGSSKPKSTNLENHTYEKLETAKKEIIEESIKEEKIETGRDKQGEDEKKENESVEKGITEKNEKREDEETLKNKSNENSEEMKNENIKSEIPDNINEMKVKENISFINGLAYFNKIGCNIDQLYTELETIKKDFNFLNNKTKRKIKQLKKIKKRNRHYQDLLDHVKEERKRIEIYEHMSSEIRKYDDIEIVKKKQKVKIDSINNIKQQIKETQDAITRNNQSLLKTVEKINQVLAESLSSENN